jgi:hypothetical protein
MGSKKTKLIYNLRTTNEWIRQSVRAIAVPIPESGHWSKVAWGRDPSMDVGSVRIGRQTTTLSHSTTRTAGSVLI